MLWEYCVKQSGKWDNKVFLLTQKYLIVATRLLCSIDTMIINLVPLEDQMIQINVSTLYANTTGFIVVMGEKNMQTPIFRGNRKSEGFFAMVMNCCGYI